MGGVHIRSVRAVGVDLTPTGRIDGGAGAVGVKALRVWQAVNSHTVGSDTDLVREQTVLRTAVTPDVDVIRGGRSQVVQRDGTDGSLHNGTCRAAGREAGGAILNFPGSGTANFGPRKANTGGRHGCRREVPRFRTARNLLHHDVVEIALVVAGGRSRSHQTDVAAATHVFVECEFIMLISNGTHIDGVDGHKRALVRRIGEHTHH